jgi:DNA-directed RNA polymerase subunit RPC12/RpoP
MLQRLLDRLRARCPVCSRRGLQGVANRAIRVRLKVGMATDLPVYWTARCRHCGARCIANVRGDDRGRYRVASNEEWEREALREVPAARVR